MSSSVEAAETQIMAALDRIADPEQPGSVVSHRRIQGLIVKDGHVSCALSLPPALARAGEGLRQQVEKTIASVPGVLSATVILTSHRAAAGASRPLALPGVSFMIAVASGKGGVGKSTSAVNLALGLQTLGLKVGLMDADIYGPSQPRLLGLSGKPESLDGKTILPLHKYGLSVMSMGFLIAEDTPMIWRGPMVMSAIQQLLRDVQWGMLDVLVIDLPPGTGDAQLTLAQQVALSGAVIISTPQDIALIDAKKGLAMFRKVNVPILGIIENMSYFLCPHCGHRSDIFSHGGARAEAERAGVPFLGDVPLAMEIRETSDSGAPVVVSQPDSAYATAYRTIAARIWDQLQTSHVGAPAIVVE